MVFDSNLLDTYALDKNKRILEILNTELLANESTEYCIVELNNYLISNSIWIAKKEVHFNSGKPKEW